MAVALTCIKVKKTVDYINLSEVTQGTTTNAIPPNPKRIGYPCYDYMKRVRIERAVFIVIVILLIAITCYSALASEVVEYFNGLRS
jgi:hypothetical protein